MPRTQARSGAGLLLTSLAAWLLALPALAVTPADSGAALDYMIIEVNGQSRIVRAEGVLTVTRGDRIVVRSAALVGTTESPTTVNVVGFVGGKPRDSAEDRGHVVDTGRKLLRGWAIDHDDRRFEIKATSGRKTHGRVVLELVEPELRYAVIKVNGQPQVLRVGEELRVGREDKFKVDRVVTNLTELDDDVTFQIVPDPDRKTESAGETLQIRFLRSGRVFARIPLLIEGT